MAMICLRCLGWSYQRRGRKGARGGRRERALRVPLRKPLRPLRLLSRLKSLLHVELRFSPWHGILKPCKRSNSELVH
jgi:hypothetical protein